MKDETLKTTKELEKAFAEIAEAYIDKFGINCTAAALSEICLQKSLHVEENWQDKALAKQWLTAARKLDKTASQLPVLP